MAGHFLERGEPEPALDALDAPESPRDRDLDREDERRLHRALRRLSEILAGRGDPGSAREAAGLAERGAGLFFLREGPDSENATEALSDSARWHEEAGDPETALELHRKVLDARSRLLGPFAKPSRESRAEVRRLERQARGG
jgi:hypothetical protein